MTGNQTHNKVHYSTLNRQALFPIAPQGRRSIFLSLLYYLKMNNPVIVGKISDLKNKDMIQLFKDVNGLDQSICMITVLKNDSLQRSSGIIVHPDNLTLDKFYVQKVKKFMKVLLVLITEDRRSMTTFHYCSVNHQSGLGAIHK